VSASRAEDLFARHCAACHGARGEADTALAMLLRPRPRSFALASFALVSSHNGVPTADDLERTLERGMPGSTMPSFSWLPADDLRALAQHVRTLAIEGHVELQAASARAAGRDIDPQRARRLAERQLRAGDEIPVPEPIAADAAVLARGAELFVERCAACHGKDGRGLAPDAAWQDRHEIVWPRDLRAGVLKGGASHRDLYWRIAGGMPAVGMPPARLSEDDLAALVAFVGSLLPPGAQDNQVQRRLELKVPRVASPLPDEPDDPRFVPALVALAPMQAHAGAVPGVEVACVHDGRDLAVLLRWPDASRNDMPAGSFPDGAAVQLSTDHDPPVLAMGGPDQPVHIWHWQSFRPRELAGDLDAFAPRPDGSRADVPLQPAPAAFAEASAAAIPAHGRGAGTLRPFRDADELAARPRWRDGVWTLVLRRRLAGESHDDLHLVPGTRVHFACAVWNGAAHERGMRKAVSVWHRLELAP
jgi:DMSO reductase family type II enzyme heme b subunit